MGKHLINYTNTKMVHLACRSDAATYTVVFLQLKDLMSVTYPMHAGGICIHGLLHHLSICINIVLRFAFIMLNENQRTKNGGGLGTSLRLHMHLDLYNSHIAS